MTDLPARTMCGVPWRRARREILLPVSCGRSGQCARGGEEGVGQRQRAEGSGQREPYSLDVFATNGALGRHSSKETRKTIEWGSIERKCRAIARLGEEGVAAAATSKAQPSFVPTPLHRISLVSPRQRRPRKRFPLAFGRPS